MADATRYYGEREAQLGPDTMREVERQVMLRLIDQHWRDHLREMDYLQDAIGLRAMGQRDPLTEWQREGFEMFGDLMDMVGQDFVKFVMRVEVVNEEPETAPEQLSYSSADDAGPGSGSGSIAAAARAEAAARGEQVEAPEPEPNKPIVKDSAFDKVGRNEPCPCGSGKKFKQCHGKA
ncbi:MAG: SEC-C metal-binding domain-containing protein [Microthrixaceae bacterium]